MGMAGMSTQILWWCHLYRPDRKYLEENAAAVSVELLPADLQILDQAGQAVGQRYADMRPIDE